MASKLGSIFVELSLDDKVYKQRLGETLTSTTATAKGIETAWRALGTKSDAIFDQQRKSAENAYTLIAAASGKASQEAVRAQQAAADKIKSINEQQYGKHTSLLEGLKQNYIAASIAIVAAWALVNKAIAYMDEGAKALQVESSFKIMADAAGVNSEKLLASMDKAVKGTVEGSDLMQKAVKLMTLGYNPEQIERFSKVVITASQIAGTSATEAYDQLADAIANRMPKALVRMGGITREQMKIVTAAIAAGADETSLYELAMSNLELKQKMLQGTQDQATLSLQRFHAQAKETGETIGKILIIGMRDAYAVFQAFGVISLEVSSAIFKVLAARNAFAAAVHFGDAAKQYKADADAFSAMADSDKAAAESLRKKMIDNFTGTAEAGKKATTQEIDDSKKSIAAQMAKMQSIIDNKKATTEAAKETERATKAAIEATRKATYEIESVGFSQYKKDIDRITAEADKYREAGVSKVIVAQYVAAETDLALRKSFIVQTEESKKMYDGQVKASEEYRKMIADEQAFSVDKHTAAMLKIVANENNKLLAAEKLMDEGRISWDAYQAYLVLVTQNTALAIVDLFQKEAKDQADYYSNIEGYAQTAYDKKLKLIELERQANILLYKDVGAANAKANQDIQKALSDRIDAEQKGAKSVITGLGDMLDAAMTCYDKESSEYKRLADAKKIIQIAELAMTVAKNAQIIAANLGLVASNTAVTMSNAGAAVTGASIGVGPTGFATAAAMIALLAGVFAMYGIAAGGGSASVSAPVLPKSTVLGAADGTASESIANSMKLMEDTYTMEDTKLTNIYNALKDLNSSIIGLVTSIFRMGGISTGGYESSRMPGIGTDNQFLIDTQQTAMKTTLTSAFDAIFISMGDWISLIFGSSTLVNNFMNAIFGKVSTEFQAGGIEIGATIVKSIIDGASISAQQYAKIKTSTTGPLWGLFGGNSESTGIQYSALDQKVTDMLTKVFSNLGSTLVELAKGLGTDVQKVYDYVFSTTQIDLNGMDAEKMSTALNDYFSSIADKATEDLFGTIIQQYQKLNEALLETAVRLVNDKAIVEGVLKMTGQAFTAVSDVVFYNLTEEWKKWAATGAFGSEPMRYVPIQTATEKTIAFSEALIELAGGLDKLTEAASTFFDKFYSDVEKQASLQSNLTDVLALQNETLPATRDGYRALVEGLDLTTTSGQEAYVALLNLSGAADQYYAYLEAVASKKSDLEIQIMQLTGDAAGALAAQRAIELAALDESLRPLQLRIYALQDEAQAITDVTTSITTLKNRAQQIAQFIIDMGMSVQAPVQSAAAWDTEYARQRTLAMTPGATDQQISDYLAFAKQYLSYEQSYGTTGSYQEIYDAIMKDVTGLGTATNTALDIAQKQLDVLIQIRDGVGQSSGPGPKMWNPTYDLGIGESNPFTSPKTYTKSDQQSLGNIIAQAIQSSNGGSNGGDIHVSVQIDGREIGNVVAKQTKTNPDLQQSIRSLN